MNFIERFKTWVIANAGLDKWYHFLGGLIISLAGWWFFGPLVGLVLGLIAGPAKEYFWDKLLKKGNVEIADALWTAAGVIPVAVAWAIAKFVLSV